MSDVTLTMLDKLLLQVVLPTLQNDVFTGRVLLEQLRRGKNAVNGKGRATLNSGKIEIRSQIGQHSGVYPASRQNATILTGAPQWAKTEVKAKYLYGSHEINDIDLTSANGRPSSIADLATNLGESLMETLQQTLNRAFFGHGKGILGRVETGATGTTITVDTSVNEEEPTKYIAEGQMLLIGTENQIKAGTADEVTVVSVDSDTQFTVDASVTTATGDVISMKNIYDSTESVYTEPMGLQGLIDKSGGYTDDFQGVDRTTAKFVNAQVDIPGEDTALTEADLIRYVNKAARYGNPTFGITTQKLFEKYVSLLQAQRRFQTIDFKGGYQGVSLATGKRPMPILADDDCPTGEVMFVDPSEIEIAEMSPVSWLQRGEGVMKWSGNNKYQAIAKWYGNLVCRKARASSALRKRVPSV